MVAVASLTLPAISSSLSARCWARMCGGAWRRALAAAYSAGRSRSVSIIFRRREYRLSVTHGDRDHAVEYEV